MTVTVSVPTAGDYIGHMRMTRTTASVAELKARLSEYLAQVKRGGEVIVTDRSVPIARITALRAGDAHDRRLQELIRSGALRPPTSGLPADFVSAELPADPEGIMVDGLLRERSEGW